MPNENVLLITDASIFFDLQLVNAWQPFFALPHHCVTSYYIWDELDDEIQSSLTPFLDSGQLELREPEDGFATNRSGITGWNRLSLPDKSVFNLSIALGGILLTSDGVLRKAAKEADLATHGLLWLFDEMVNAKALNPEIASEKLETVFDKNIMYRGNQKLIRALEKMKEGWLDG